MSLPPRRGYARIQRLCPEYADMYRPHVDVDTATAPQPHNRVTPCIAW